MPNVGEMTKKQIVEELKARGIEFNPKALKNELENVLAAAMKEKAPPEAPEAPKEEKTGKITKEELKGLTCLRPGYKAVRMSREQAHNLQCWYNPKTGIGVIKG